MSEAIGAFENARRCRFCRRKDAGLDPISHIAKHPRRSFLGPKAFCYGSSRQIGRRGTVCMQGKAKILTRVARLRRILLDGYDGSATRAHGSIVS